MGWLADVVVEHRAALHLALTYDGRLEFEPQDALDDETHRLFDAHQRTEKGFGPALGPDGWRAGRDRLADARAEVTTAESDWRLGPADGPIQRVLLDGFASAAIEMAPDRAARIAGWHRRRAEHLARGESRMLVGHTCLTALPPA